MSVNIGENGRRSVQVEVEVPGSPEEVWQAIATGPGISSWFVPTEVDGRVGGLFKANFGPGMESESTITHWDPPRSFAKDGDAMDPNGPPVATEWIVEAKSGGMCVVRVVHSWFANSDDWDGQWESVENGWVAFFNILRLSREHFPGQPSAGFEVTGTSSSGLSEAWGALTAPLGLSEASVGQEARSAENHPGLSGKVALAYGPERNERQLIVLTSAPGNGIGNLFAMPMGAQTYLSVRFYLFGDAATDVVAHAEPVWRQWFDERFPAEG